MKQLLFSWLLYSILVTYVPVHAAQITPLPNYVGPYWMHCRAYIQAPEKHSYTLSSIDPNNIVITATSKGENRLWEPTEQGVIWKDPDTISLAGTATAMTYFPSPRAYSAVGFQDGSIKFYHVMNKMTTHGTIKDSKSAVVALAISTNVDNPFLAAAFDDKSIKIWKIKEDRNKSTFYGDLIKTLSYADQKGNKKAKPQKTTLKPSIAFDDNTLFISDGDEALIRRYSLEQKRMIEPLRVPLEPFYKQRNISLVATAPKSDTIAAVAPAIGSVFLLNKQTGTLIRRLLILEKISCIDISADGTKIVVGSAEGTAELVQQSLPERRYQARVFDAQTGALLRAYTHEFPLTAVRLNRNGSLLVSSMENAIMLWDVQDRLARVYRPGNWIYSLAFPYQDIAMGLRDGSIVMWDGIHDVVPRKFKVHDNVVTSLLFAPNDQTRTHICSASRDGKIKRSALGTTTYTTDAQQDWVNGLTLLNNGTVLTSAGKDGSIRFWSPESGGPALSKVIQPAGIVYKKGDKPEEGETEYDALVAEIRGDQRNPKGHSYWVMALATLGNTLISGSYDGTVQFWNLPNHTKTVNHGAWVHALAVSPAKQLVASAGGMSYAMGHMGPWAVRPGSVRDQIILGQGEGGGNLASRSNLGPSIKLWDSNGNEQRTIANAHGSAIFCLAFSPDGTKLASGSADGTAKIWDVASGKLLTSCQHYDWVYTLTFSPDGKWLVTGTLGQDGSARDFQDAFRSAQYTTYAHAYSTHMADIIRDTKTSVSPGEAQVCIWDVTGI